MAGSMIRRISGVQFDRWRYAIRYWFWHSAHGFRKYDRRKANFEWCNTGKAEM